MARDHARLFTSIWTDPDFVALSAAAQRCYMLLLSQPDLSYCGATGITIRRWANMSERTTTDDIQAALDELEAAGFIVTDQDTEEVLVRSFMRNDGLLKSPNMAKAATKAATVVLSEVLRAALMDEFERVLPDIPEGSRDAIREGLPKGFGKGSAKGSGKGYRTPTPTPTPTPAPANPSAHADARAVAIDRFPEFWDAWVPGRKVGKDAARKAFRSACRRADVDAIIAGAARFAADPNLPGDLSLVPHPASWLNAGRWDDPPLPPRQPERSRADQVLAREMERSRTADAARAQSVAGLPPLRAVES